MWVRKFKGILNVLFLLAVFGVNIVANLLPFNNTTTEEVSDRFPSLMTPSGYTFMIWGLIYALLLVFSIYQLREAFRRSKIEGTVVEQVGPFFAISCLLNMAWVWFWHQEELLISMILIGLLLITLIIIYIRLGVGVYHPTKTVLFRVDLPFSVYLGWVSLATIANVSSYLNSGVWDGFGLPPEWWAALMVGIAGIISLIVIGKRNDVFFGMTICWAIVGIYINTSGLTIDQSLFPLVMISVVAILIIQIIVKLIKRHVY